MLLEKFSKITKALDDQSHQMILDGEILVNNEPENRRGRKLYSGDIFSFDGEDFKVLKDK